MASSSSSSFSSPSSHVRSPPGFTPLMTACALGSITDVSSILVEYSFPSSSLEINASTPDGGDTALHMACGIGDVGIVSLLLAHGADPNVRDKMGMTPAHAAVLCSKPRNSIGVLRVLASFGGDLHLADTTQKGFTPLHYCCAVTHSGEKSNRDDEEVIWSIIEAGLLSSSSPASLSSSSSSSSSSSMKSDEELILQRTKETSQTAIHISAQRGHSLVLHNLLKRLSISSSSSSPSPPSPSSLPRLSILNILALVDSEGNTPLHLAVKRGHKSCCSVLHSFGASWTQQRNEDSQTPLDILVDKHKFSSPETWFSSSSTSFSSRERRKKQKWLTGWRASAVLLAVLGVIVLSWQLGRAFSWRELQLSWN